MNPNTLLRRLWRRPRTLLTLVFAVVTGVALLSSLLVVTTPDPANADQARIRGAARMIPVAAENGTGYKRSYFGDWTDVDRDCRNTRAEVLIAESRTRTTGGCTIRTGRWHSYYDKRTWTRAADVDIDHLVPLAEAWASGARRWNAETRARYANDLGDPRALVAVTNTVNRAKSAKDPAEWLPKYNRCRYVREWVAIKLRWRLTADKREKLAIVRLADRCPNTVLKWKRATIRTKNAAPAPAAPTSGLKIVRVVFNPPGDERYAPNTETVRIKNTSKARRTLTGLRLRDATASWSYTLPARTLAPGAVVTIHSGSGKNTTGHLYARWNRAVWNNSGDTARLISTTGKLIHKCTWTGRERSGIKYC